MAEYIEREAVLKLLEDEARCGYLDAADINGIPAADVALVVRCKDCAVPHNKWTGCPNLNGLVTYPDFYCALGERKAKEGGEG